MKTIGVKFCYHIRDPKNLSMEICVCPYIKIISRILSRAWGFRHVMCLMCVSIALFFHLYEKKYVVCLPRSLHNLKKTFVPEIVLIHCKMKVFYVFPIGYLSVRWSQFPLVYISEFSVIENIHCTSLSWNRYRDSAVSLMPILLLSWSHFINDVLATQQYILLNVCICLGKFRSLRVLLSKYKWFLKRMPIDTFIAGTFRSDKSASIVLRNQFHCYLKIWL